MLEHDGVCRIIVRSFQTVVDFLLSRKGFCVLGLAGWTWLGKTGCQEPFLRADFLNVSVTNVSDRGSIFEMIRQECHNQLYRLGRLEMVPQKSLFTVLLGPPSDEHLLMIEEVFEVLKMNHKQVGRTIQPSFLHSVVYHKESLTCIH